MKDFAVSLPTKIIYGPGRAKEIGKYIPSTFSKILFVYGEASLKNSGLYDAIVESLNDNNIQFEELSGVSYNADMQYVDEGVEIIKQNDLQAVLAVGGGGVIDTAKTIAAAAKFNGDIWDFFENNELVVDALPQFVVQTTCSGTTSITNKATMFNAAFNKKCSMRGPKLFPQIAVLDPETTLTSTLSNTLGGSSNVIASLIESYFNGTVLYSPLQDTLAEGLIRNVIGATNRIIEHEDDVQARSELMWASSLVNSGVITAGNGIVGEPIHMISHATSTFCNIPLEKILPVVTLAWLRFYANASFHKMAQLSRYVFRCDFEDDLKAAYYAIDNFEHWFKTLGSPVHFGDLNIDPEVIPQLAAHTVFVAKQWGLKQYTAEVVDAILIKSVR